MLAVTPRPPRSGDGRTRTGGLSPDKRALCAAELRPRAWRGWDSNPRSRAHEAREDSRSSTALGLAGRSRTCGLRFPKPAGWPTPPQPDENSTPGGARTRSFRVEGPASSPVRPRGHERLRRQGSNLRLTVNSRASCRLDYTGTKRKGRESNPQDPKAHPFSRRSTAPMAALPGKWPRQDSNLHHTDQESAALPIELQSQGVAGRDRTCGAPRFRRALYRAELRPRVSRRGWTRTSSLLFVRQALFAFELLADQGGRGGSRTHAAPEMP
jgi:hypothetical protein